MKNIFEIMKEYGLEVPEDKRKEFEAAVLENYSTRSDYEKQKTALDSAGEKLKTSDETMKRLEKELEEYKDADVSGLKKCQRRFKNVRKRRLYFVVFRRSHVTFSSVSLLKKCVYDLLLLTHEFLAFFQPV